MSGIMMMVIAIAVAVIQMLLTREDPAAKPAAATCPTSLSLPCSTWLTTPSLFPPATPTA